LEPFLPLQAFAQVFHVEHSVNEQAMLLKFDWKTLAIGFD